MNAQLVLAGTRIRHKHNPSRVGVVLGPVTTDGGDILVQVRFEGSTPYWEIVDDLELADAPLDEATIIGSGRFAPTSMLRRAVTSVQLADSLSELIYSMDMTNTEFMPHQFKPLLALLDSPSRGLLIADEVGLGKTIEAGLIWTELRFRANAKTLLVICPAMLMQKWSLELSRRFGTRATIMDAAELLDWIDAPTAQQSTTAIICSLQGLRPPSGWNSDDEASERPSARLARRLSESQDVSIFDLAVVDEAQYLRNDYTASAELARLLRPVSEYFILLSATPVNTSSNDLFNLVTLIDPDQFQFRHQFVDVIEANRPLVLAINQLKRGSCTAGEILVLLQRAADTWLLSESQSLQLLREELAGLPQSESIDTGRRVEIAQRLERINLLGHAIVRSRKREVIESRVERRVHYIEVEMTAAERALYETVSAAIINYATENSGVPGFLLAMPQQQMSSCMFAAADRWRAGKADDESVAELAYESLGEVDIELVGPVRRQVEDAVRGRVDLSALRSEDSKFARLLGIVLEHVKLYPDEKILVFSYFRDTLAYLKKRLDAERIPSVIVQGGLDKQDIIDSFRADPSQKVLLASEVAAEGVDLQFMRLMISYDLPWNPMRVEQRIGRIDRIGQTSEAITIFSLVYADTIDAKILNRLFRRLRLFEESIGALEDVVGEAISQLTQELLSARLTEAELDRRIESTRFAIDQRRRNMELVEENAVDLVGLGDLVRDRVRRVHDHQRHISDLDLLKHVEDYLESSAPGYRLQLEPPPGISGKLQLPPELAASLRAFREYRHMPRSRLESGHLEHIVIRNHVDAAASKHGELINQFHPLVRLIASRRDTSDQVSLNAVQLSAAEANLAVEPGDYAFASEVWRFRGVRDENTIRAAFVRLDDGVEPPEELEFDLLNAVRTIGIDYLIAFQGLPEPTLAVERLQTARRRVAVRFRREWERRRTENSDRAGIQRQSIERNRDRRRHGIDVQIERQRVAGRRGLVEANRARLARLLEQAQVQLARVEASESLTADREALVAGVLRVVP